MHQNKADNSRCENAEIDAPIVTSSELSIDPKQWIRLFNQDK